MQPTPQGHTELPSETKGLPRASLQYDSATVQRVIVMYSLTDAEPQGLTDTAADTQSALT